MDCVATITCLAETPGRIGWGAVSVDSTHEPLAGALTLASVFRVREERWRADTLTGLHTLLIGPAVVVPGALGLVSGADSRVRVPCGTNGADAAERPNLVLTQGSEATGTRGGEALVDVSAGAVRVDVKTRWTGTVADPSSNGDALSSLGAVSLVLAGCEDALAAVLDVGRLAATVWSIAAVTLHKGISIEATWTFTVKTAR